MMIKYAIILGLAVTVVAGLVPVLAEDALLETYTEQNKNTKYMPLAMDEPTPDSMESNKVLSSSDCDDTCILELNFLLDTSEPLGISFMRFIDSSIDGSEGLYIQYSTDGTNWKNLSTYTEDNNEDTDEWAYEYLILDIPEDEAGFRLLAMSSEPDEYVQMDDLVIRPHIETTAAV